MNMTTFSNQFFFFNERDNQKILIVNAKFNLI